MFIRVKVTVLISLCTYDRHPGCTYGSQVSAYENDRRIMGGSSSLRKVF